MQHRDTSSSQKRIMIPSLSSSVARPGAKIEQETQQPQTQQTQMPMQPQQDMDEMDTQSVDQGSEDAMEMATPRTPAPVASTTTTSSTALLSPQDVHQVELIQRYMRLRLRFAEQAAHGAGGDRALFTPQSSGTDDFVVPSSAGSVDFFARKLSGDSQFTEMALGSTPSSSGTPASNPHPGTPQSRSPLQDIPKITSSPSSTPSTGSSSSGGMFARRRKTHSRSVTKPPPPQRKMRKRALTIETIGSPSSGNTQAPVLNRVTSSTFDSDGFLITRDGVSRFPESLIPLIKEYQVCKGTLRKLPTSRSRLDEFKSIGSIGEGRSSRVALVRDEQTNALYARKTIYLSHEIPNFMVCREITAMIMCYANPHIVKFVDAFYDGFCVHIFSEYIEGDILSSLEKQVNEQVARAIIYQALIAMDAVHSKRLLHMDIKLSNMILTPQGVVVLYDFGLSLLLPENDEFFDRKFSSDGTIAFMSPEKMQNMPFCFKSDIWSLGVSILRLLSGYLVDANMENYYASMENIIRIPTKLDEILGQLNPSPELMQFLRDCLRVEPSERPSVRELFHQAWLQGLNEGMSEEILRQFMLEKHKNDEHHAHGAEQHETTTTTTDPLFQ